EPHQIDLWRIRTGPRLTEGDLEQMIAVVTRALLPGMEARSLPASHPYTLSGFQIDVRAGGAWVEIGECGLALPAILEEAGLDPEATSGLRIGPGVDQIHVARPRLAQ